VAGRLAAAELGSIIVLRRGHWPRHVSSMPLFGVTVRGFWTDHQAGAHRLIGDILDVEELLLDRPAPPA
jgi:hypothetical protein